MMLNVETINVYYGAIHAIKDVSFHVEEGEIVTLIGANGAGKSTILKTISGLLHTKTGGMEFLGRPLAGIKPHKIVEMGLAHVPEGRRVFTQMSVEENLEMGGYTRPKSELDESMEVVYQRFPRLKERRRQVAGTLSGGEQQMLAVGRALMSRPKVIMMDEPSLGLAPIIVKGIFEIIKEINKQGVTVLLIEQNANMALKTANLGYVMETGRITLHGSGEELLANEAVKAAYLGT